MLFVGSDKLQTKSKIDFFPYLLILPTIGIITLIFLYPMVVAIDYSLCATQVVTKLNFVGLANYQRMFTDPKFWHSLRVTVIYTVGYTIGVFVVGFFTALLVNFKFKGRTFVRAVVTAPYAISSVVVCMVWMWMYDYQFGIANFILTRLVIIRGSVDWLDNSSFALFSVLLATIWKLFPMHTLVLLAAFQSVPGQLYESAQIDGANSIQRFFLITIPFIRRILGILFLLTIIWCFKRFTILWIMTAGGPARATEHLAIRVYRSAFKYYDLSFGATMGIFTIGLLMAFTLVYLLLLRE